MVLLKKSKFLLSQEEIEKEEREAERCGLTIFQYRHLRKVRQKRHDEKKKERLRKKKLAEKYRREKLERLRLKKKRIKEKEQLKEKEKKEKLKEKERLKKLNNPPKKKKKVGRHKKTGPKINYYRRKKKKLEAEARKLQSKKNREIRFKVVATKNGVEYKNIGVFTTLEKAYNATEKLLSEEIYVPQKYIKHNWILYNVKYEYLILEHKTEDNKLLRNEYGKLVEQKTTSNKWGILDKIPFDVEETFWVWGYHQTDRKNFKWIYDNILFNGLEDKYSFKRVTIFKDKIIFMDDNENIDIIFTKCFSDAVKFYNKLEEIITRNKIKQIIFMGNCNEKGERRDYITQKIMEKTGWTKEKTNRAMLK